MHLFNITKARARTKTQNIRKTWVALHQPRKERYTYSLFRRVLFHRFVFFSLSLSFALSTTLERGTSSSNYIPAIIVNYSIGSLPLARAFQI